MLDLFLAKAKNEMKATPNLSLDGPAYWYMHQYFKNNDFDAGTGSFLNLYEDTNLSARELKYLQSTLTQAITDLKGQPQIMKVFVGWIGTQKTKEAEEWVKIEKENVEITITQFLKLIETALQNNLMIFAIGD